ncbi:hypothetical protein [Tessaracoccus sp. G1721]
MSDDVLIISRKGQLTELWDSTAWRVALYLLASVALGVVAGLLWSWLAPLPAYTINDDMTAVINERAHTSIVAADVAFTFITGAVGLVLGAVGWVILHRQGWVVIAVPLIGSLACALTAWQVGLLVGESGFVDRLAGAQAGDVVRVDLMLRALSALLVAPFAAITPIMLMAAFWPEPRVERPEEESGEAH